LIEFFFLNNILNDKIPFLLVNPKYNFSKRRDFFMVRLARHGVISWNKDKRTWSFEVPEHILTNEDFFKCPRPECKSMNLSFIVDDHLYFDSETNSLRCKAKIEDWYCMKCGNTINFENLSEITRSFFTNQFLKDLEILCENSVMMIVKVKGPKQYGFNLDNKKFEYRREESFKTRKCGNCKKKNLFDIINRDLGIYQCYRCGYINIEK